MPCHASGPGQIKASCFIQVGHRASTVVAPCWKPGFCRNHARNHRPCNHSENALFRGYIVGYTGFGNRHENAVSVRTTLRTGLCVPTPKSAVFLFTPAFTSSQKCGFRGYQLGYRPARWSGRSLNPSLNLPVRQRLMVAPGWPQSRDTGPDHGIAPARPFRPVVAIYRTSSN